MAIKVRFSVQRRERRPATDATRLAESHPAQESWPAATRYRRQLGAFVGCVLVGVVLSGASLLLPDAQVPWLGAPGVALVALGLLLFFALPALDCPVCGRATDSTPETYCPTCGASALAGDALRGRHCTACGQGFGAYKYRQYRIHYCTHCAAPLSRKGV